MPFVPLSLFTMKTKLLFSTLLSFVFCLLSSQVPQGFNYQAIARDGLGTILANQSLPVKIDIQTSQTGGTLIYEELFAPVTSNQFGLISLVVGTGVPQSGGLVTSFSAIDWKAQTLFLKTIIQYPGTTWTPMGTSQIWGVPYSLVAKEVVGPLTKLGIAGTTTNMEEALFEVKNKSGNTVFAVYNEGVRAYVGNGNAKGVKGGFAVGGYDGTKGVHDLLLVNSDSVRMYIDSDPTTKGVKGGFAVGGYDMTKGTVSNYLNVSIDSNKIINPAQNRILWYPLKNAFLTGKVLIENRDSVGINSFASGFKSKAKGDWSQALGYMAAARGNYSTSIGENSTTSGNSSFAFGKLAKATANDSYAFGTGALATGPKSFALGSVGVDSTGKLTGVTKASGEGAFALGFGSVASSTGAFTFGVNDAASGPYSLAMGYGTVSSGWLSTTTGVGTYVEPNGWCAIANGFLTKAGNWSAAAFGDQSYASGHTSFATGYKTLASGHTSSTFGEATSALGYTSTAFGRGTIAQNFGSVALGSYNAVIGAAGAWNYWEPVLSIGNGTSATARSNAFTFYNSGIADFAGYINLNTSWSFADVIRVNNQQALWFDGTYFSWGYGANYNVFARPVSIGTTASPGSYALYVAGNLLASGSVYGNGGWTTSDARWKKDLEPLQNVLPEILNLQGLKYSWRKDEYPAMNFDSGRQIGIIAQDVEKIFPELVRTDDKGYKAVSYEKLSVILLEGMKEQQKQIKSQQEQIYRLEEMVGEIQAKLGDATVNK
jgi:hypothetical protein